MTELDESQIANYWQFIINKAISETPMLQQACLQTAPEVKDGRVTLVVENEVIKDLLAQKALDKIEKSYQELGFPKFRIHPFVDQSASQAKIEELKALYILGCIFFIPLKNQSFIFLSLLCYLYGM